MLEPLIALSLVASIVQIVDFGGKFIGIGYRAFKTCDYIPDEDVGIQTVYADLLRSTQDLKQQLTGSTSAKLSKEERQLQDLSERTVQTCSALFEKAGLPLDQNGSALPSTLNLRQALIRLCKSGELRTIEATLEKLKTEMTLNLSLIIRNGQSSLGKYMKDLDASNQEIQDQLGLNFREVRSQLDDLLKIAVEIRRNKEALSSSLTSRDAVSTEPPRPLRLNKISQTSNAALALPVLRSLYFCEMNLRDREIREAYEKTYSWLLEHTSTPFRSWLENGHGVFWVSGEAGSGKSTLMKFIAENLQTLASLERWAGGRTLATGVFYFWNSGVSMQKSQEGLLRSLLFHLLWKCPELIKGLSLPPFQGSTDAFRENDDLWTIQQLKRTLHAVLEQNSAAYCFCFFIDGLDEYVGEHYELVRDLSAFSRCSWVKLCVSSRPWNVFRDAYGSRPERHLILQDLNKADIEKYVGGMLGEDVRFDALSKENPRASDLVTYIQDAAQGVFLWVFLVVRSLLCGIAEGDSIETLEWRIWQLPTELDAYFKHMLDSTEDVSRELTARSLLIATAAEDLLPVCAFRYMELERNNPDLALWPTPNSLYRIYRNTLPETVRKSIDHWCRGFLEIRTEGSQQSEWEIRVGFMHRIARDYLLIEETQRLLRARCGPSFEAHDLICQFELMELKSIDTRDATRRLVCTRGVIRSAKNCETRAGVAKVAILREADRCTYREASVLSR